MASSGKAIVKDPIYYGAGGACMKAPCGEYTVDHRCDCVELCDCSGGGAFTLSFDAFLQHLNEGRIAFVA